MGGRLAAEELGAEEFGAEEDAAELQDAARALCLVAAVSREPDECRAALERLIPDRFRTRVDGALLERLPRQVPEPDRYYECLLGLELGADAREVRPSFQRRRRGSHFTDPDLALALSERALAPLLAELPPNDVTQIALCDPAVGAGAFLRAARQVLLSHRLGPPPHDPREAAACRRLITQHCLYGVDTDRIALWLAEKLLGLPEDTPQLVHGSALGDPRDARGVDFPRAFPGVFGRENPGFDAIVGNPPWVAYVGRAAQPLDPALARDFARRFTGFRGYKTLHGLFVEQSARLLRSGGRLGLLVPTSMTDLVGYAPTRAAHDALCRVDDPLPDFGERFARVFQPCVGLLSTRVDRPRVNNSWPIERPDLSAAAQGILSELARLPKIAPALFGERGYQTHASDRPHLRPVDGAVPPGHVVLHTGTEVTEFRRLPARLCVDPKTLSQPLRPLAEWQSVPLWIRQTARFPICALSDGRPFRNSIIAGFENDEQDRYLLLAYLNSTPVRWLHFHSQRDARQGMPQLKVAHLRALPAPPTLRSASGQRLRQLGQTLGTRNLGVTAEERASLDSEVGRFLGLSAEAEALVSLWGAGHPPPASRFESRERVGA